jgi:SAM-dependent methyltransferase
MSPEAYLEMAAVEETHWWFCGRRAVTRGLIERLGLPASANILEVGCGTGGNLRMLSAFGKVSAMERDAVARSIALKKTGIEPLPCDLPDSVDTGSGSFQLVCLFDVLEHVERDADALRALLPKIGSDGRLLLTVPAYQWLWSEHDVHLHHFRRYTMPRLRELASDCGYEVQYISYLNSFLFPLAAIARGLTRVGLLPNSATASEPAGIVNATLRRIFEFEAQVLRYVRLPFGISLIAVLRAAK